MTTPTLGGWLVHVLRRADGALSLEDALHVIMDSIKEYFPCQSVAVILIDDDTKALGIKISRSISYTFAKRFHRSGPGPVAEQCVLEQKPLLLNAVAPGSPVYEDLKLEHDFSSAVLAPVVKNQRGVGYIFADRHHNEEFTQADLLHLQVIGYLIGQLMEKFELIQASRKLSTTDDATGVLQYKAFVPALAMERGRAAAHGYHLVLALLSVRLFRQYVETHGIGDAHALLAEVAGIVRGEIRDMDILARFGADEFVLCLSGMTRAEAEKKLEAIHAAVPGKAVGKGDAPVEIAVGALALDTAKAARASLQDVLAALGRALVDAKARGAAGPIALHEMPA